MIKTKNIRRRNYRNLAVFGLGIFVAVFLFVFLAQRFGKIEDNTSAANLANFNAGYIISDYQMTDYNSMSEADIQNWLNAINPCSNTTFRPSTSKYKWHFENGHYICLSQERFGDKDGEIGFQYGESAAHIIWQAAQDFQINPKVLIVLIQKETGLITDPIPNDWDYRRATGYGCPDTAACSEKYYGFKNQVRNAAYLFRIVMDGNSSYYPIGYNNVRYSPDPACGSSVVYIQNLATSALYRYTPYQPNAGALAAGYGTAPCGAYGNRNFYAYFEDWFGGATKYRAEIAIQDRYDKINGKDTLGAKTKGINCSIGYEGACVQAYEKGVIIYNASFGAWENYGAIRSRYVELGSVDNIRLGFPTGAINCYKKGNEKYCVQAYERGIVVTSDAHGTWENFGMIRQRYRELGSVEGSLGFPVGKENCNIGHNGACVQQFEGGVIIAQASTGAWENYGAIRSRYVELGGMDGVLGLPVAKMNCDIGHEGACVQAYENGVIIYSPVTGAWESYGEVRKKHVLAGSVDGYLGFPIGGVDVVNGVQTQKFQGGVL